MSAYSFGDSSMEGPALRDVERWKDKIEVHLDNRQVFFLFFGSALVACLLFILGVIVGKRLESRGRADAPAVTDPLALLDKVAAAPAVSAEQELTFPKALLGGKSAAVAAPRLTVVQAPVPTPKPAIAAPAPAPAKPVVAAPAKPVVAAPTPAPAKPVVAAAPGAAKPATQPIKVASTQPVAVPAPAAPAAGKGKYTLQLSSFQDRAEAESYAKRFASSGAYIVTSEVPEKGTWYRVRVGAYASSQDALNAKSAFEKKTNIIAYIALR